MPALGPEIIIATRNAGKMKEFEPMFRQQGIAVRSLLDYPELPDIVEDGDTFAANAFIKARTVAQRLGVPAVADDSGLCVDRLDGAPGIYSARYAGEPSNDAANNRKLLAELAKRGHAPTAKKPHALSPAQFVCAIALVDAEGNPVAEVEGVCEGVIIDAPRGERGFGYDPLFYIPDQGLTLAELTVDAKNALSHRGRAIGKLWEALSASGRI